MACNIAPHKGRELEYVSLGIKAFATLEFSKDPEQYNRALGLTHVLSVYNHTNDMISVTRKENAHLHSVFKLLISDKANILVRSKDEKHILLGRLFGYTDKAIYEFINSDITCDCPQCKFGD